jgi:hypothetical protein
LCASDRLLLLLLLLHTLLSLLDSVMRPGCGRSLFDTGFFHPVVFITAVFSAERHDQDAAQQSKEPASYQII